MPQGKNLRIILLNEGMVHWSTDAWKTSADANSRDTGLGVHAVDLETKTLSSGSEIVFTFFWKKENRWEGADYKVKVE